MFDSLPIRMAPASLSFPALSGGTFPVAARWRPGLAPARHSEIFAHADEASGAGLALSLALDGMRMEGVSPDDRLNDRRGVLWVQDKAAVRLSGRPYRHGLPAELRARLIHVAAKTAEDALFALEEGLRCRDLACVIGEISGNPRAMDFTASRRLSLAAERHGVPLFLVRLDAQRDLSSARMRWQVCSTASLFPSWNKAAPGSPSWQAELFRARGHRQGKWILRDDGKHFAASSPATAQTDHGDLAGPVGDGSLAPKLHSA
jgi:protein ImuA